MREPKVEHVEIGQGKIMRALHWPGEGDPLVLLHGLFDSSEGWSALADTSPRPCIAFDLPGFGESDPPERPRISSFARAINEALDAMGIERCVLAGHSLGGAVAAGAAEQRPDRFASIVLLAPAGFGPIRLADFFGMPLMREVTGLGLPLFLSSSAAIRVAYRAAIANGRAADPEMVRRVAASGVRVAPGARMAIVALSASGHSKGAYFKRRLGYPGPVTALWGSRDRLVPPAHAKALRRSLPQARVEVWRGMGHHPQAERPLELAVLVEESAAAAKQPSGTRRATRRAKLRAA